MLQRFLYTKWFFLLLTAICAIDLLADAGEHLWGWTDLNFVAIAMDASAAALSLWIFTDLHRRRPRNGSGTGR